MGLSVKSINVNKLPSFKIDDDTCYPISNYNSNYYNRKIDEKPKVVNLNKFSCLNCHIDL